MKPRRLRWIIGVPLLLIVVVLSVSLVGHFFEENQQGTTATQPTPTAPGTPNEPSSEAPGSEGDEGTAPTNGSKSDERDALNAAVYAQQTLTQAQLLEPYLVKQTVDTLVVSEARDQLTTQLSKGGKLMALYGGYSSLSDALANSEYSVRTLQYRTDSFDPADGTAHFTLYTYTHFVSRRVSATNQLDWASTDDYSLNVVYMRWVDGRWLYIKHDSPPAGQTPVFTKADTGLTPEQVNQRYKPFLGGFKRYG